jgi:hypothetical protein
MQPCSEVHRSVLNAADEALDMTGAAYVRKAVWVDLPIAGRQNSKASCAL